MADGRIEKKELMNFIVASLSNEGIQRYAYYIEREDALATFNRLKQHLDLQNVSISHILRFYRRKSRSQGR